MSESELAAHDESSVRDPRITQLPLIILNPASDRGKTKTLHNRLVRALANRGELVTTSGPGNATTLAAQAAIAGRSVVAVGGDGTIAEAASGILQSGARVPLGIVPSGSGNDYAQNVLHLPHALDEALEIALTGTPLAMDAGLVNGRYFVNAVSMGIDANMAAAAEGLKRVPLLQGQALYWAAALQELLFHYSRCPNLHIVCDGDHRESRDYAVAAVNIGPTYGGGFRINPGADPRDGQFDVCTIWKPPLGRALKLLPMIEKGQHINEPEVSRFRARSVVLESAKPIYAQRDGEVFTAQRFEVQMLPGALLVRQPTMAASA